MSKTAAIIGAALLGLVFTPDQCVADCIAWSELKQSCNRWIENSGEEDGNLCRAFVSGYLLGAEQYEAGVNRAKPPSEAETYTDRAIRTRTNSALLKRVKKRGDAPYCFDADTRPKDIARAIGIHVTEGLDDPPDSAVLVQQALAASFPCDA